MAAVGYIIWEVEKKDLEIGWDVNGSLNIHEKIRKMKIKTRPLDIDTALRLY